MAMVDPSPSRAPAAAPPTLPSPPTATALSAFASPQQLPPPAVPTAAPAGAIVAAPAPAAGTGAGPSTTAPAGSHAHNDKAPTKKKQLGNWLFKKFGGSGIRSGGHHQQHSFDSAHEHHSPDPSENGGTLSFLLGANPTGSIGSAAGAPSGSRHRRPSFPRTRKNTSGAVEHASEGGPKEMNAGTEAPSRNGSSSVGRKHNKARPASADAKTSSGAAGVVSSFWRASHIDGVPTPSLPKGKTSAASPLMTSNLLLSPESSYSSRPHASSPGLTDGLADTLVLPLIPSGGGGDSGSTTAMFDGLTGPPQLPDPILSSTADTIEPPHLRSISPVLDPENRTATSSPSPSQTAFSIGTTSLGTDTSAPASSINSLVRIRNGTDLRNNGTAVNGLVVGGAGMGGGGGVASSSRLNGDTGLLTDVLDIPDGSTDHHSESDSDSDNGSDRAWRRRYSGDNATMDTGKSVSTKPTTVMSLDTRDASGGPGMAHIAQYRHGDPTSPSFGPQSTSAPLASRSYSRYSHLGPGSIHFADQLTPAAQFIRSTTNAAGMAAAAAAAGGGGQHPPSSSSPSTSGAFPGQGQTLEDAGPFVNVPSFSRPHPFNNPAPQGIPADNASMLTLASSTAAQSIMGGPGPGPSSGGGGLGGGGMTTPSIRNHGRATSVATRSLGGSLMGDRRNSSDTYASLKALPPLSRRGSDASNRTGLESVAPSVSGVGLGGAGAGAGAGAGWEGRLGTGAAGFASALGGPGAPIDRVSSLHRSPSMRTVNTQLSVPLSLAAAYQGAPAPASTGLSAAFSASGHLGGSGGGGGASTGGGGASPLESGSPSGRAHSGPVEHVRPVPGPAEGGGIVP
ncbi:unnamed protein product [Tilletia controversa]|uniref:Uncharacterized protein n=1 Tax=Tilletia caries TaxID=13290 RepID=A0A177UJC5_9BASI|nr:hypothetical protein CF336_g2627 [Tilletia laevis]KAE8262962.1 hypothetical protein A4X03_0g2043 [Tilletia caries]CAD6910011.1 unnamed protein product [Tilletia controversa]KAE8202664.1 hypothetical protein CF335_g3326 [Tilletia laevis]CAD6922983.1 unnamed protein product [Tilletia caries]